MDEAEKVEIRYRAPAIPNKRSHRVHIAKVCVVRGPHNRYLTDFGSIDEAVEYALNNGYEIVGLVKE